MPYLYVYLYVRPHHGPHPPGISGYRRRHRGADVAQAAPYLRQLLAHSLSPYSDTLSGFRTRSLYPDKGFRKIIVVLS